MKRGNILTPKLEQMLVQARKAGIGIFFSHQDLSQTDKKDITSTIMVNTATKFVHTGFHGDATRMAASMQTTASEILALKNYHFAMFQKSTGMVAVTTPNDPLGSLPQSDDFYARKVIMESYYREDDGIEVEEAPDEADTVTPKKKKPPEADITPSDEW